MIGMHRTTGASLDPSGNAHLEQSVNDILTTPIGSRVGRREYGSLLPELLDQPFTRATVLKLYAATASALSRWEKRIKLKRVRLSAGATPEAFLLTLEGERTDRPATSSIKLTTSITRSR